MRSSAHFHCVALLAFWCAVENLAAKDEKVTAAGRSLVTNIVELRGKVIGLDQGTNAVRFKTETGIVHPLVRNQKSEALFTDTNLLAKTLIVKGRVLPQTQMLEIIGDLHSWRDGRRYELFYYCNICSIKTSEPGLCMCCREPVVLVEEAK